MKALYFTATGNNLFIAKKLGGEFYSIPKLLKENKMDIKDEQIGIIFPVFYSGLPEIVEEFLDKAHLISKYIFVIASYGSLSGGTYSHLLEIADRNGIKISYYNEILMVDNYLPVFDMNKQIKNESGKKVEENLDKIINDIKEKKIYTKKSAAIWKIIRSQQIKHYDYHFEKNFSVDYNCNGCKVCEKVCPVDNIKVDIKPGFSNHCQHCLACIHNCPQSAISIKKEKNKTRFRNHNVTLNEIISANN